ncbi:MAG: prolyl oligopeptidase family serine peptidase [Bacteroidetes bacterium]|jgi:dipeptidyl aminopeptidase/acylaminoacyl peptidase|nr:prolyl oligopeptidase family serine peptidase [Bacteroidota bacterium]
MPSVTALRLPVLFATALAILFFVPHLSQAQETSNEKHLDLEMYWELQSASNPQLSPDGSKVVYTRGWIDRKSDDRKSEIWMMDADGERKRFLAEGSSPTWAPDGTRIAYLAEGEPDGNQIYVRWMDAEGATSQITRMTKSPSNLRWSPDSEHIAFNRSVETSVDLTINMPSAPSGAEWTPSPKVVERPVYRRDRQGYVDDTYTHLFVVSANGGAVRQLTDGDWNHSAGEWTADGEELVFSSLRVEDAELQWRHSEIYAVSVEDGAIRQLTDRRGPDSNPLPSPDGRYIAYMGDEFHEDTYRNRKIHLMDREGANPRVISGDYDRSVRNLTWAPDGSGLYFAANNEGNRNVHFVSVNGGVERVTDGVHQISIGSISDDGHLATTQTSFHEPGDIYLLDPDRPDQMNRLTHMNRDLMKGVTLGEVEEIWYTSVDDLDIQGWVVKPPNFDPDETYPLMLAIHGGPHGMYGVGFSYSWQEHAANGYLVLYTNPRGSSGYGSAFGNEINNAYPSKDYDDLMAGVDAMISRGNVDEDRMYVYGCSGGGVLTAWVVGHTDRFAAASSNCPVTNWLSFVGTTDGVSWYNNFEAYPWDDPTEHLERSPLMHVGNVTTPTMLMTGENDLRTPMAQTEEYYAALQVLGVPTAMVRFQNEWHGTSSQPSNFIRSQLYLRSWFEQWP